MTDISLLLFYYYFYHYVEFTGIHIECPSGSITCSNASAHSAGAARSDTYSQLTLRDMNRDLDGAVITCSEQSGQLRDQCTFNVLCKRRPFSFSRFLFQIRNSM
jgi:hypothetical protein